MAVRLGTFGSLFDNRIAKKEVSWLTVFSHPGMAVSQRKLWESQLKEAAALEH